MNSRFRSALVIYLLIVLFSLVHGKENEIENHELLTGSIEPIPNKDIADLSKPVDNLRRENITVEYVVNSDEANTNSANENEGENNGTANYAPQVGGKKKKLEMTMQLTLKTEGTFVNANTAQNSLENPVYPIASSQAHPVIQDVEVNQVENLNINQTVGEISTAANVPSTQSPTLEPSTLPNQELPPKIYQQVNEESLEAVTDMNEAQSKFARNFRKHGTKYRYQNRLENSDVSQKENKNFFFEVIEAQAGIIHRLKSELFLLRDENVECKSRLREALGPSENPEEANSQYGCFDLQAPCKDIGRDSFDYKRRRYIENVRSLLPYILAKNLKIAQENEKAVSQKLHALKNDTNMEDATQTMNVSTQTAPSLD